VEERGILVRHQARCTRLITDADGNVVGVLAKGPEGSDVVASARRAVVLTCGGFAYNAEMQMDYVGTPLNAFGPPGRNTGDGIKMALAVGADLWHMNAVVGPYGYKVDGYDAAFHHRMPSARYIYLDQNGRRFLNEMGIEHHACTLASLAFDPTWASTTYPRIPSYVIFDERTRRDGPICSGNSGYNRRFAWSEDNSAEIEKGWIKRANTIEDLANQLELPVNAVVDEIGRFGRYCAEGNDPQFGRQPEYLLPLDSPPYYGVAIWPTLLNTQGGPRRDKHARVLDPFGQPIPGLFSAGELGSMWGMLYPGAGNVSEALIFGRIAGANAAAVPPPVNGPTAADEFGSVPPERERP
jgi:succinate dehydrogenase/fumarate reductase flavoprotein subunit